MGVLQSVKETAEDAIKGSPTAELREFFDPDWSRFDHRSISEARDLLDRLKRRRKSERQKMQAPSRFPEDGEKVAQVARKAERRIEWLEEQIETGKERVEALQARRDELREEAARVETEAQEEMTELAAEALGHLEEVASVVEKVRAARQRVLDARKEADMRTDSHRPHPARTAGQKLQQLRATLNKLAGHHE